MLAIASLGGSNAMKEMLLAQLGVLPVEGDPRAPQPRQQDDARGSRPMFWFSSLLALVGTALMVNDFLLLIRVPFLHAH
jgi:hypothetical protein